jgi:hypothetical protein
LDFDISGSLDKSKTPGSCGFPLPNPQSAAIVDFVPMLKFEEAQNILNVLMKCANLAILWIGF